MEKGWIFGMNHINPNLNEECDKKSITTEEIEKKISDHHNSTWHNFAGVGSVMSLILPWLSEFETIGESIFLAVGGTSAVSVFAMLLKIGRVTVLATDLEHEHEEHLREEHERINITVQKKREHREKSNFIPDF